jgi:hypothetical protein
MHATLLAHEIIIVYHRHVTTVEHVELERRNDYRTYVRPRALMQQSTPSYGNFRGPIIQKQNIKVEITSHKWPKQNTVSKSAEYRIH